MNHLRLEEYKFLRQELEMNRRFVFERPLLIVGATLAAALSLSEEGPLGLLLIPFLGVLTFNLWFTFNRLQSSSRIVAYIQLVHEGQRELAWIGWENALRVFRQWCFEVNTGAREPPVFNEEPRQYDAMGYYGPIYFFHLFLGVVVTVLMVAQSEALQRLVGGTHEPIDPISLGASILFLVVFCLAFLRFRPSKVRHRIEWYRDVWKDVCKGVTARM